MKSLLPVLSFLIFLSLPTQAASLLLDMRADMDSASYNQAAGAKDETAFLLHTTRVDLKGTLTETLSYRLRFRLNNEGNTQGPDQLSSKVDFASVTHKTDLASFTFGKTTSEIGGHETLSDSRDLYMKSEANKALTGTYSALSNSALPIFYQAKYDTGVKAQFGLGDSDLTLMVMNNTEAESSATPRPQNRFLQGAAWKGKFAGNTWQPVLSYHTLKSNLDKGSSTSDTETKVTSAGLKWASEGSFAQIDYVQLKAAKLALATTSDFEINSVVLEGGYQMGQWTPRLKAEMSKVAEKPETGAKTENDVTGYSLAVEYRVADADLARYHVALSQKNFKQDNTPDRTENHVIAGFTFAHDLLK